MTGPIGGAIDPVGVAYAEVRFRGDKAPKDVARILDDAGDEGNVEMAQIGDKWGETLDKHMMRSTKSTGRDVARGITSGIEREGVRVTRETIRFDRNGNIGQRWVTLAAEEVEKAVDSGPAGTAVRKAGEAFTSAIGAGFNVSGRSSLIAFLIPLIGVIVELVGAAVQGAAALSALLFLIPNLVFAVGLQAGVLLLAFDGIGQAITGAFAAKNIDEFNKALENLTPSARDFVGQIVVLRDTFKALQQIAQEGFFKALGDTLLNTFKEGSPIISSLGRNIGPVAESLGRLVSTLIGFFNDPAFINFVDWIVPQITTWLDKFGPAMITFLTGLSNLGVAILPFFVWFGNVVNDALAGFGGWLDDLSHNTDFLSWLDDVKGDLSDLWDLLKSAGRLVMAFFSSLNSATAENGGFIKALTEQLDILTEFFKSPLGEGFLRGLISLAVVLSQMFIGLVVIIGLVFVAFEGLRMAAVDLFHAVGTFFEKIGEAWTSTWSNAGEVLSAFGTAAVATLTTFGDNAVGIFTQFRDNVITYFTNARDEIVNNFQNAIDSVGNFFQSLPTIISDAVGDLSGTLWNAGSNLVQGLINGALSKLGPLRGAFSYLMQNGVLSFLPHSPAKEGPLSGEGDPMIAGATIVQRIATGMQMEAPSLADASAVATSNVLVGSGAVQMNFYGPAPTAAQATGIGAAAGGSLADVLAKRNARLAIRSIGAAAATA